MTQILDQILYALGAICLAAGTVAICIGAAFIIVDALDSRRYRRGRFHD